MDGENFDRAYYQRFYYSPQTRIAEPAYFERLARFLAAYIDLLGCPVSHVLDAGCGAGLLHSTLKQAWPDVQIDAFDISPYACERYGWMCSSIEAFTTDQLYDLVICHDVVQYLDRKAAAAALDKLAALTTTALFFGVLTTEDWNNNCDQELTDSNAHLRRSQWYRKRLSKDFFNAGGGLYIKRDAGLVLYALETL